MHYGEILYFLQHGSGNARRTFAVVAWMIEEAPGVGGEYGFKRFKGATHTQTMLRGVDYVDGSNDADSYQDESLQGRVVPLSAIKGLAHIVHDCDTQGGCVGVVHQLSNQTWLMIDT